ncbi:sensor histidine kinase [Parasporobacterium paucivorans]|uniref:Two-component system, sensor histidine kinase YesM n=1 Tax=Parasporobacterium paucivorans DSM 15970 TaxID=1122934 RepID=A0A1M6LH28_9FIRM|nr:sensor histidine kinase [Parasporobacterium paucivorans]SHJ70448.1 two-component system, sensor histidine kinase YesM [Parasporobacterium paucivorans DSM 15970]
MNIKEFFDRINFKTRLLVSFFIIAVPILIIISIVSYTFLSLSAQSEVEKSLMTTMERIKNEVERVTGETENLSRNIIYNDDVQRLLAESSQGEKFPTTSDVAYFINSFIVNREFIESVVITGENETLFSTERAFTNVSSFDEIQKKWWYEELDEDSAPFNWYPYAVNQKKTDIDAGSDLMLTRSILSLSDYKTTIGRMMIYIKNSYLMNIWNELQWGETTNVWVVDGRDQLMLRNTSSKDYSSMMDELLESSGTRIIKYNGEKFIIGNIGFDNSDWKFLIATPLSEVDDTLDIVKLQIVLVAGIVLLIILIISFYVAGTTAKPIVTLSETMDSYYGKETQDNKQETFDYEARKDEVGDIYRSYQKMRERIETLIKEIYLKDLEKKDAELALLETQINPHFLYNTLDSINWMALANEQEEISEMITALSDTFRLSLTKNNSSFVSMEQEIQYIESYMIIQKFRYGNKLAYRYDIDENVKKLQVLRFVLQPIIENGLKHGIDTLEENGSIELKAHIVRGRLEITVTNDGANIDLSNMKKLLEFDVNNTEYLSFKGEGYGIQNINRRIKIVHGEEFGIRYEVVGGAKTVCIISLPALEYIA